MTPASVYRALRIVYQRGASNHLRALAARIIAAEVDRTGAALGFGGADTWRDYAKACDALARMRAVREGVDVHPDLVGR